MILAQGESVGLAIVEMKPVDRVCSLWAKPLRSVIPLQSTVWGVSVPRASLVRRQHR